MIQTSVKKGIKCCLGDLQQFKHLAAVDAVILCVKTDPCREKIKTAPSM